MIGSFWNLCRACPSMPVDKLHSEYRSTYRWHEYTGPRQDVIRRPPQPNVAAPSAEKCEERNRVTRTIDEESFNEVPKLEPALPRRKKHPELAYRTHEFMTCDGDGSSNGPTATAPADRARSEERGGSHWRPSRRSKSEGPARANVSVANGMQRRRRDSDPDLENTGRDPGLLKKAISKISTEYRLQFAWPPGRGDERDSSLPRKSLSMGAIKPAANAMIHKKRTDLENRDASELEPLVNDNTIHEEHKEEKYAFVRSEGRFNRTKRADDEVAVEATTKLLDGRTGNDSWFKEVVELRKKAGEYKHRGWGTELAPDRIAELYNKQIELWDQVSRRSSLSALSLASTSHRSYTKEEKEQENNKKSSPTKALRNAENSARMMKDMIRHHLVRTTGGTEFDGLILSPTREKLEPTIPRKDDDSRSSQKNSPQKCSPQKGSPQKSALQKRNSQKSKNALRATRSQSVGPTEVPSEKRSPKRQSRSATVKAQKTPSTATSTTTAATTATPTVQKRPRPSSLNTTASSRYKCSSVPPKSGDDRLAKAKTKTLNQNAQNREQSASRKGAADSSVEKSSAAPTVAEPEVIDLEPVIKSPPEPTRVKSPEQILMRSPDPVNWTVPLDTGKTFTVTQNVREGDPVTRPHSEVKAWTPPDVPPPAAQSAPPGLAEQAKVQGSKAVESGDEVSSIPTSCTVDSSADTTTTIINGAEEESIPHFSNLESGGRPVAGTKLRCLDDPLLEGPGPVPVKASPAQSIDKKTAAAYRVLEAPPIVSPTTSRSLATEVLEKARNRFDMFWGKNSKDDNV